MNKTEMIISEFDRIILERKDSYKTKIEVLNADDRRDEANIEKVKANICEIFNTLLTATLKKVNTKKISDEDIMFNSFCDEYLKTFDVIPKSWVERFTNAKKHNDYETQVIEEAKLGVAEELKQEFIRLKEVQ